MAPQQAAWGTDQAAQMQAGTAAAPAAAAAAPAAAQAGYAQYYKQAAQQAAPVAAAGVGAPAGQPVAAAGGAYPYAAAAAAAVQQPRLWVGTVTQLIPPNYGVVDGDAYYINAVVVGDVPKVGAALPWLLELASKNEQRRVSEGVVT